MCVSLNKVVEQSSYYHFQRLQLFTVENTLSLSISGYITPAIEMRMAFTMGTREV